MVRKFRKISWLGIFRILAICAGLATGGLSLFRDYLALAGAEMQPGKAYWTWIRICFIASCVIVWFQEHRKVQALERRLAPELRIVKESQEQPWTDERGDCVSYFFKVRNNGEGTSIEDIAVKLIEINPPVQSINWLPVTLHIKHDNRLPYQETFSLNPQDNKLIDLVSAVRGQQWVDVIHIVEGVLIRIPATKHRLTVTATGKNVLQSTAIFEIWMDESGYLRCVAR
jgi:hypothetical protein